MASISSISNKNRPALTVITDDSSSLVRGVALSALSRYQEALIQLSFLNRFRIDPVISSIELRSIFSFAIKEKQIDMVRAILRNAHFYSSGDREWMLSRIREEGYGSFELFLSLENRVLSDPIFNGFLYSAASNGYVNVVRFLLSGDKKVSEFNLGIALYYGLAHQHAKVMQFFLDEGLICESVLGSAIINGALNGSDGVVRYLILKWGGISEEYLGRAFHLALTNKHENVVQVFLEGKKLSEKVLEWALMSADIEEDSSVIQFILAKRDWFSEKQLGQALFLFIRNKKEEMISGFLEQIEISKSVLSWIFISAVLDEQEDLVRFLLTQKEEISEECLGRAFHLAIKNKNEKVIRVFLEEKKISEKVLDWAVMTADSNQDTSVIRFLLRQGFKITKEYLVRVLCFGIKNQETDLIRFFLEERKISVEFLEWVFQTLKLDESLQITEFLMAQGVGVAEKYVGKALQFFLKNKQNALIQFFLENKKISEESLGWAVFFASMDGDQEVIRFLMDQGIKIPENYLGRALQLAIKNKQDAVMQIFLEEKKISEESLGWAVFFASMDGDEEVIRFLMDQEIEVPPKYLGRALQFAIKNKQDAVIRIFLEEEEISEEVLAWAVIGGAIDQDKDVIQVLMKKENAISERNLGRIIHFSFLLANDSIKRFFLEEIKVSKKVLEWSIVSAAFNGDVDVVRFLTQNLINISEKFLGQALQLSIKNKKEAVELFFFEEEKIPEEVILWAVIFASLDQSKRVVKHLIGKAHGISERSLAQAFYYVMSIGNPSFKEFFFDEIKISDETLGWIVVCAARNGNKKVIELLLSENKKIPKKAIGLSLYYAVRNQDQFLKQFFLEGERMSKEAFSYSIIVASMKTDLDVLRFLVSREREILDGALERALYDAILNNQELIYRFFLDEMMLSEKILGAIIFQAAQNGHDAIMRVLREEISLVPQNFLDAGLCVAAQNGHKMILIELLSVEEALFTENILFEAMTLAASNGHEEIIRFLWLDEKINQNQVIGSVLFAAAENGQESIVRFLLLKDNPIAEDALGAAAYSAKLNGHAAIFNLLVAGTRPISKEILDQIDSWDAKTTRQKRRREFQVKF